MEQQHAGAYTHEWFMERAREYLSEWAMNDEIYAYIDQMLSYFEYISDRIKQDQQLIKDSHLNIETTNKYLPQDLLHAKCLKEIFGILKETANTTITTAYLHNVICNGIPTTRAQCFRYLFTLMTTIIDYRDSSDLYEHNIDEFMARLYEIPKLFAIYLERVKQDLKSDGLMS